MIQSPDTQAKLAAWRLKAAEGTLTLEESIEAVKLLRAGRMQALASSASSTRKKAIAAIPAADDLLAGLDSL